MIEALIEFLMANLAIVIFLVGGIYSLLKRSNDEKGQNRPKQKAEKPVAPTFTGEEKKEEPFLNLERYFVEEKPKQQSEPKIETSQPHNKIEVDYVKQALNPVDKKHLNMNKKIKSKKVVEGVIWSEILGPPRSKKQHLITKYYRHARKG